MKNIILFTLIMFVLLFIGGILISQVKKEKSSKIPPVTDYEYYFAEGCEHCKNVTNFMESWDKGGSIKLNKKNIKEPNNLTVLVYRAANCQIPEKDIGIPFLVTPKGECIFGDQFIIEHLKRL
jgi:hypothetical protein